MRHAHRFRRDGSNFLGIHRHGSPPSSASPDALALVLLSVLPILSCFSRLYFFCHSPSVSFGSWFLILSDSARPANRLRALMEIPVIYIWTHDSISQGEDGPTHQPVEHLISLRAMPGLIDMRPADANEVVEAWKVIMELQHEPVVMVLSRQALPTFDRTRYGSASGVARGAYVMADAADGKPDVLLLSTGSEVSLCIAAYEQLNAEGVKARVVSMPSWKLFERQSQEYRESVIPPDVSARVAVEEASTLGWAQYVGLQ